MAYPTILLHLDPKEPRFLGFLIMISLYEFLKKGRLFGVKVIITPATETPTFYDHQEPFWALLCILLGFRA